MWLTPRRGWWLGVALTLLGMIGSTLLITAALALGGQELATSLPVWVLLATFGVAVPLGAGFLIAAIVAGRILRFPARTERSSPTSEVEVEGALFPKLSARVALLMGLGLLLAGLIVDVSMLQPPQTTGEFPSIENDVLTILVFLSGLLTPIGIVLVPGAWLLGMVESRSPVSTSTAAPSALTQDS